MEMQCGEWCQCLHFGFVHRGAGMSKILVGTILFGGHNLPPLIEIEFINLPIKGWDLAPTSQSPQVPISSGGPDSVAMGLELQTRLDIIRLLQYRKQIPSKIGIKNQAFIPNYKFCMQLKILGSVFMQCKIFVRYVCIRN